MSLILEALKKSEAKRRLGEAPDLGTPFTLSRRRRSPLPLVVIAVLVLAGLAWWFLRPHDETQQPAATATTPAATQKSGGGQFANVNPGNSAGGNAAPSASDRIARQPRAPKPPAPTAQAPQRTAPDAAPAQKGDLDATRTVANTHPMEAQPLKVPPKEPAPAIASTPANATAPAERAGQKQGPPPPDNVAAKDDANTQAATDTPPPAPMYYELAFNLRKDLPPINLAMHVYAKDPAQRFAIINGDRFAEGDTVKDDLVLRQILPDGLLMEFRGQRFFYPRSSR